MKDRKLITYEEDVKTWEAIKDHAENEGVSASHIMRMLTGKFRKSLSRRKK